MLLTCVPHGAGGHMSVVESPCSTTEETRPTTGWSSDPRQQLYVQQRRVEVQVPQLFAEWELGPVKSQHGHMRMTRKVQNTSVTAAIRWYLLVLIPPNPQTGQPNKLQL